MRESRWILIPFLSALITLTVAGVAWAHVEISPGEVQPGGTRTFTVGVPTERDVPTTEIRLEMPGGFRVVGARAPADWRSRVEDGAVVWSGGSIPVEESEEFSFEARVSQRAGEFSFEAVQIYQDGTVVRWDGAPDSEEPAPVVQVASRGSHETGGHEHGAETETLSDTGGASPLALAAACLLVLGAAALALIRRMV